MSEELIVSMKIIIENQIITHDVENFISTIPDGLLEKFAIEKINAGEYKLSFEVLEHDN